MTIALRVEDMYAFAPASDRGLSEAASQVRQLFWRADEFENSVTVTLRHDAVRSLQEAVAQARERGWNGYDAEPANAGAFMYALQLIANLSLDTPSPEVAVDVDGDIAVEWDYGPRQVFSVRIGRDGTLNYAGLIGHTSFHGTEFLREGVPSAISAGIDRVFRARV